MSETVVSLRGGAVPMACVPDERIVLALKQILAKAERGEISSLMMIAVDPIADQHLTTAGGVICQTTGDARMMLGYIEETKAEIVANLKDAR